MRRLEARFVDGEPGYEGLLCGAAKPRADHIEVTAMGLLLGLIVIFIIFMVAGWGWRKGRG